MQGYTRVAGAYKGSDGLEDHAAPHAGNGEDAERHVQECARAHERPPCRARTSRGRGSGVAGLLLKLRAIVLLVDSQTSQRIPWTAGPPLLRRPALNDDAQLYDSGPSHSRFFPSTRTALVGRNRQGQRAMSSCPKHFGRGGPGWSRTTGTRFRNPPAEVYVYAASPSRRSSHSRSHTSSRFESAPVGDASYWRRRLEPAYHRIVMRDSIPLVFQWVVRRRGHTVPSSAPASGDP